MSRSAQALRTVDARVRAAAEALARADFVAFAAEASELEAAGPPAFAPIAIREEDEARRACLDLHRSLARLGALMAHVAGVGQALRGGDPADAAAYDRTGAGQAGAGGRLRAEG